MKKEIIAVLLTIVLLIIITACAEEAAQNSSNQSENNMDSLQVVQESQPTNTNMIEETEMLEELNPLEKESDFKQPEYVNPEEFIFVHCSNDCWICFEVENVLKEWHEEMLNEGIVRGGDIGAWLHIISNLPLVGETVEELNEKIKICGNITDIFVFKTPHDEVGGIPISDGVLEEGMVVSIFSFEDLSTSVFIGSPEEHPNNGT